ncbi:S1 RNA-binding domain-containing protein [Kitasatospora sp. NPDC058162]|uniref:S1 RNA-binding domain-containing protein n=1 Tax=Kitasatospora sp. NPDC058162 TaxID=3346362 RepID=UPI0036DD0F3E
MSSHPRRHRAAPPSHVYRITKYDPADRDERGCYTGAEEAVSDHGPVEAAYLEAVAAFAEESGVRWLSVREPQAPPGLTHFGAEPAVEGGGLAGLFPPDPTGFRPGFHDGARVPVAVGLELVRAMLRGSGAWCRLETEPDAGTDSGDGPEPAFAVHVGWDQYVYVGSDAPCPQAVARTRALGLHPEPMAASPYEAEFDEPGEQCPADEEFWARVRRYVTEGRAALLEESPAGNATRWHRLGDGTAPRTAAEVTRVAEAVDAVRARLAPRAQLAVWPELFTDVAAALAALPEDGLVEFVREGRDGRITGTVADAQEFRERAAELSGARAAAVLSVFTGERGPLFTAVLPDADGVLRARWRTEPAPGDRDWAFLRTLRRGQAVTGTVTEIASFGVTFVDIGGFTAMINIPELSWRPVDRPGDVVAVGQRITAEVLDVDPVRERVSLSLKGLQPDPMREFVHRIGRLYDGVVTAFAPFGVFVRLEDRPDGLVGLVHTSELAPPPAGGPGEAVRIGDLITVMVIGVDPTRRRITLSQIQAQQALAQEQEQDHAQGQEPHRPA